MAKPRVFISSTYYDLKHVRASLEVFVESLGYEPILAEYGSIAYDPSQPLDESCYREAQSSDILVLVIGGRYGSLVPTREGTSKNIEKQLESITRREFSKAHDADIPVFVLIENGVHSEYQTYLRNKDNSTISYAHVDSEEVFKFIEFVYGKQRNNPIQAFEKGADIEAWLRDQWAGIFQDLLKKQKDNRRFSDLASQIRQLEAVNSTLKSYLETVLESVSPDKSEALIKRENQALSLLQMLEKAEENEWFGWVKRLSSKESLALVRLHEEIGSALEIVDRFKREFKEEDLKHFLNALLTFEDARRDFNQLRGILGLSSVRFTKKVLNQIQSEVDRLSGDQLFRSTEDKEADEPEDE